jgi:hypothetical protein
MLQYICNFILLYMVISAMWPDRRKERADTDRKLREVVTAIAKLERQKTPSVVSALPTFNSAERARVLALGRTRDGKKRQPILDTPWQSVANPPDQPA